MVTRRPLVYGHRGASARAPENTAQAFALALSEGADGVELDVRLSRDDVVMVVHDPDLLRVAGRPQRVAELDAHVLQHIDVGGDVIPTLDDVLDSLCSADARVNIELKGDVPNRWALVRAVSKLLHKRHPRERELLVISSFWPGILAGLRALGPPVSDAFLFDLEHTGAFRAAWLRRALRPKGLHPHYRICNPNSVARWHARGLFVNAWTVDSPIEAQRLAKMGVDGIITNDPATILDALDARPDG
jgi:glycerophosphoryl diester phosphodiesterase